MDASGRPGVSFCVQSRVFSRSRGGGSPLFRDLFSLESRFLAQGSARNYKLTVFLTGQADRNVPMTLSRR